MKYFLIVLIFFNLSYATDGMKNISLNTVDSSEVISKVMYRFDKVNLTKLKPQNDYKEHIAKIESFQKNNKDIILLQNNLRDSFIELKTLVEKYKKAETLYQTKMDRLYNKHKYVENVSYHIISYDINTPYLSALKNYLVDEYGIEKYDQVTKIIESSSGAMSYSNVVTILKDLGQIQIEDLHQYTYRERSLNVKIVKVIQSPFVKSKKHDNEDSFENSVDKFALDQSIKIFKIENSNDIKNNFLDKIAFSSEERLEILSSIESIVNQNKFRSNKRKNEKKINSVLKSIEKTHDNFIVKLNDLSAHIKKKNIDIEKNNDSLKMKLDEINDTASEYSINFNLDELYKLIVMTPKLYTEYVELGEEKEFIQRKVKSYLKKISITELQQSETLTNHYDLKTKNIHKQKFIEYESIHILPFMNGRDFSVLIFSLIELENKISQSDFIKKNFKYSSLTFVPIKQRYKTIFAANTELTLGIVKEFLKKKKQDKYFDKYCLEDSDLPQEAKSFKNLSPKYYNYPAVCFKPEKIDLFLQWLSKKTKRSIVLPTSKEWSYVASNANSSKFCWGNKSIDELNEDELKPENIYYEDDENTYIKPVKKHEKSILGMYDMCGNVHELVKDENEYAVKGTSYISFLEDTNTAALEYDDRLNSSLGMRVFYIKEN